MQGCVLNPSWMPSAHHSCFISLLVQLYRREEIKGMAPGLRKRTGRYHPSLSQAAGEPQLQCPEDLVPAPSALAWVWAGLFLSHILIFASGNNYCSSSIFSFLNVTTKSLPSLLVGWALASGRLALELSGIGSVRHREAATGFSQKASQ